MENKWTMGDEMRRKMKYQYRRVDVTTLAGLKAAERLQARGWKPVSGALFTVLLQKGGNNVPRHS